MPSVPLLHPLQTLMAERGWDALWLSGTDPHDSEYPAGSWLTRQAVLGFSGSAGHLALTPREAALWTDSRYWLQAETELAPLGAALLREGEPGVPDPGRWLAERLPPGARVVLDSATTSQQKTADWTQQAARRGWTLLLIEDPLAELWDERPPRPDGPLEDFEATFHQATGLSLETRAEKLARVRAELTQRGAGSLLLTSLDEIAWLLNLRGTDIPFNPLFLAGLWISRQDLRLFLQPRARLSAQAWMNPAELEDYTHLEPWLRAGGAGKGPVWLDPARCPARLCGALSAGGTDWWAGASPIPALRAKKSAAELAGFDVAHLQDARAWCRFYAWWDRLPAQTELTEQEAARRLEDERRREAGYRGPSFEPIPGWGPHGAIVHYKAPAEAQLLGSRGLFLLDTGAHYQAGTTDITRTLVRGEPTEAEREDYTAVLKAHLALSGQEFPEGTRGYALDALARGPLWASRRHYGHGTGHGVGHVLCVHEGPQRLGPQAVDQALVPGMVVSNEPGLYRPGAYGIRIENLMTVEARGESEFARWLGLRPLTWVPYERRLIKAELLEPAERQAVDAYHAEVWARLGPGLASDIAEWLKDKTAPLTDPQRPG